MSQTLIEKALSRKAGRTVSAGEIVTLEPDRVMSHDNTAFIVKKFLRTGYTKVWNADKITIVFDHCVPAVDPAHQQNHDEARAFVAEQGITRFFDAGVGVCHQLMVEKGMALPGQVILGADSHSTLYGAMNAIGIPINRTEMAGVWATGEIWLKVPTTIRVELEGTLAPGVYAKDAVLTLLRELRADGAAYRAIEFAGPAAAQLTPSMRMTFCNMAVELGAKCGVFACDDVTETYLQGRTTTAYQSVSADPDAVYERVVTLDLSTLEPQVAKPHTVDNVFPLTDSLGTPVHLAYLGSCTNGRLEDFREAARVLNGKQVAKGVRLVVYPASTEVAEAMQSEGVTAILKAAGAEIMGASCGPCFGAVGAILEPGQACISSSNRNFCGRMGSKEASVFLASPATVAASAVHGVIADPRAFQ
jgi:homoaconitate hydratase family protein